MSSAPAFATARMPAAHASAGPGRRCSEQPTPTVLARERVLASLAPARRIVLDVDVDVDAVAEPKRVRPAARTRSSARTTLTLRRTTRRLGTGAIPISAPLSSCTAAKRRPTAALPRTRRTMRAQLHGRAGVLERSTNANRWSGAWFRPWLWKNHYVSSLDNVTDFGTPARDRATSRVIPNQTKSGPAGTS